MGDRDGDSGEPANPKIEAFFCRDAKMNIAKKMVAIGFCTAGCAAIVGLSTYFSVGNWNIYTNPKAELLKLMKAEKERNSREVMIIQLLEEQKINQIEALITQHDQRIGKLEREKIRRIKIENV